jgi:hypothetical protein
MLALLRSLSARRLLLEQVPALLIALGIAEAFYKFKSFTLEAVAFLATWAALEALIQGLGRALVARAARIQPGR